MFIGDDKEKEKLCKSVNAIFFDKRLLLFSLVKFSRQEWFSKNAFYYSLSH